MKEAFGWVLVAGTILGIFYLMFSTIQGYNEKEGKLTSECIAAGGTWMGSNCIAPRGKV